MAPQSQKEACSVGVAALHKTYDEKWAHHVHVELPARQSEKGPRRRLAQQLTGLTFD